MKKKNIQTIQGYLKHTGLVVAFMFSVAAQAGQFLGKVGPLSESDWTSRTLELKNCVSGVQEIHFVAQGIHKYHLGEGQVDSVELFDQDGKMEVVRYDGNVLSKQKHTIRLSQDQNLCLKKIVVVGRASQISGDRNNLIYFQVWVK